MKYLLIVMFILGLGISHRAMAQEQDKPLRVYYTASSRGYYYEIALQEPVIKVFHSRDRQVAAESELPVETWSELRNILSGIELKTLPEIHTYIDDAAVDKTAIAQLRVCHGGKSYKSPEFDQNKAPNALKSLISKMQSLAVIVESEQ
ncbi:hypothetical protein PP178_03120 [Zeaxanthinibacter sp. PT1]|uniref:hypothetical protein n=1 Tax=Zeaxanthinibacter TaxID=561554 RepID=UPI00234B94F6|nr:hypothetical protein [Zeaxanthinibacter sp. PT1]MDC6350529.1 hypothetical protein [Zeaxanthinibacter sp. PT1]